MKAYSILRYEFQVTTTSSQLKGFSIDGCEVSKSITIVVFSNLYMPNSFTPNNDGKNDIFRIPPTISFHLKDFSVYDRWGNKVFSTDNIGKGWDGTYGGKPSPTGIYVYFISGYTTKGNIFSKGTIMLIR